MRILFLVGRDSAHPQAAGGDLQAWTWATWLAAEGHDVTLIAQAHWSLAATDDLDGVHVIRLGNGPALAWRAWRYYVRSEDFDLVYEDPIGAGRTPYLSPLWSRKPVIAVWHQVSARLFHELHPRPVAVGLGAVERLIARLYRRCYFWAPSTETAQDVNGVLGFPAARIHVVHPTSEPARRSSAPRAGARHNVVSLGLIRPYKNFDHIIRALPAVASSVPDVHLTIAGRSSDDSYLTGLRALATELGVEDRVTFRLHISAAEKTELLEASDVMVLASLLEGYGIVTIEANAAGVPVVASSGVPTAAVEDGVNGIRYEFGDVAALARAITTCLTDDDLYRSLSEGAVTVASERSVAAMSGRFAALVDAAMGHPS